MDFDFPAQDDPRRLAVRAWLDAHPSPSAQALLDVGYLVPHWPKPYGLDADGELQIIIDDELKRAGVVRPGNIIAHNNCGPALLNHGTPQAREKYLMPALLGEHGWCQLFSEPSGGSDLAALRTSATRDGDHYIVRGQKIWTSGAHRATIGVLVCRTDDHAAKHAGLSQFLVDLRSPGITIRPIADMRGDVPTEFNEVFFDDVRVPVENRLGEEGDGWRITMQQLQSERVAISGAGVLQGHGPSARDLINGLREIGRLDDGVVRDRAAGLYIEGELIRLLALRTLSDKIGGRTPGPEAAIQKMLATVHGQKVLELAKNVHGHAGMLEGEEQFPGHNDRFPGDHGWDEGYWQAVTLTLRVGSQEVMKNVVSERLLGLPRELDPSAKGDWSEHRKAGR
ncbi:acyl-CoA dehydrogenase family protein [Phenylobacterium sp.]|uniref:acyl-CoA dehydrogenase family protein n=1 Tax=Phenylobacterium sp. TaxID=1871053 RepID=UPI002732E5AB|nr:acyl-CoA dehydrogenase family protein [Phenylobacterium sp.]MDP3659683.1 acyl-CoA dehydrogenase family protein [Phenylobacterium sp.]